jgi:dolichol-phosphate mannosyltransferase
VRPTVSKYVTLTIVIPCYNEERTLARCIGQVRAIADENLTLEIIIVDDHSNDASLSIAYDLANRHAGITVLHHLKNLGKGAALKTGFAQATGDYVAIQDADLEYDPWDLKRLLQPLVQERADVVFGSRFLSTGEHRVLYFWHSIGNRFLTLLSNMFTDLNISDMESCYKVFRREIIQSIDLKEKRFGFEPEIVAKVAGLRVRIYEMGISYHGRTYNEGKKVGLRDGVRALYCVIKYNNPRAALPIQFFFYTLVGCAAALINLLAFKFLLASGVELMVAAPLAFLLAAVINYFLCIAILFRHKARWKTGQEIVMYFGIVCCIGVLDLFLTRFFIELGITALMSKAYANVVGLAANFLSRRFFIFPEPPLGPWKNADGGNRDECG